MTDLLGLLSDVHRAVNDLGGIRLIITDVEGLAGVVDRYTGTIHISPGLTLPETLRVLADAVAVLAPPDTGADSMSLAAGAEGGPSAAVRKPRHLRVVPGA